MRLILSLRFWLPLVAVGASAYLGYYIIGRGGFSEQRLVFSVLGLISGGTLLYALTARTDGHLRRLMIGLPLLWLVGVRGLDVAGLIEIFMPQLALYALALILLIRRVVEGRTPRLFHATSEVVVLGVAVVGALSALLNGIRYDLWVHDVLSLGSVGAAFFCVYDLDLQVEDLKQMLNVALGVIILIAISGLGELALGIGQVTYVPKQLGFGAVSALQQEDTGFFRVSYLYWGGYVASTLIFMTLPLSIAFANLATTPLAKRLASLVISLCVIGVAVSGYRGLWLAAAVVIGLTWVFLQAAPSFWSIAAVGALVVAAPTGYYARFLSIFSGSTDSSAIDRVERVRLSWELALRNPIIGAGWGASGWVHNDWVQIAADAGLPAAVLFFAVVIWLAFRLLQAPQRWPALRQQLEYATLRWLSFGLGLALVAGLLAMLTQTFIVAPIAMSFLALLIACAQRTWDLLQRQFEAPVAGKAVSSRSVNSKQ